MLQEFLQKAIQAHNWTSHAPEKRGEQLIKDYSHQLASDIGNFEINKVDQEIIDQYIERYKKFFSNWLNAKGNTSSPMITGPANYNIRRHEKTQRSEQRHYDIWQDWRLKAITAINRKERAPKTYTSELERYRAELEVLKQYQVLVIEANKKIRKSKSTGENIEQYLIDTFKVKPHMMTDVLKWGFNTTNNNANIKRVEGMIKQLENKETAKEATGGVKTLYEGDNVKIIVNYELDRIQIVNDGKPDAATIALYKNNGYKWAPSQKSWQRQYTANALCSTNNIISKFKEAVTDGQ
jgi:hypothetical protein